MSVSKSNDVTNYRHDSNWIGVCPSCLPPTASIHTVTPELPGRQRTFNVGVVHFLVLKDYLVGISATCTTKLSKANKTEKVWSVLKYTHAFFANSQFWMLLAEIKNILCKFYHQYCSCGESCWWTDRQTWSALCMSWKKHNLLLLLWQQCCTTYGLTVWRAQVQYTPQV
jgi:hypothetical protein